MTVCSHPARTVPYDMIPTQTCIHGHSWEPIKGGSTLMPPHSSGSCTPKHIASSFEFVPYVVVAINILDFVIT